MMNLNRKEFLCRMCFSAACACGFTALASTNTAKAAEPENKTENSLQKQWIAALLHNMEGMDPAQQRSLIKQNAIVHYNSLDMDSMLAEYQGDLKKFIGFLEKQWGWMVQYDEPSKTLTVDENKSYCVCPMISAANKNSGLLCYCSEGFAERMFSKVAGAPAKAKVETSILRGDKRCKYRIVFS